MISIKKNDIKNLTIQEKGIIITALYKRAEELVLDYDYNFSAISKRGDRRYDQLHCLIQNLEIILNRIEEIQNEHKI